MRILITGGSGFIGRYFCERFSREGHPTTILDLVPPSWEQRAMRFVKGDVRDPASVRHALQGCDAVLHLAAAHHDFGISPSTYFAVNEAGSAVLCEAMDELGVRDVCFLSTVAVYGDAPEPHTEDSLTQPSSPYGKSKLAAEQTFHRWTGKGQGRRALVIRPTVVFGPRNFANMYSLIRQIHRGFFLPVGRGTNVKSLAYVENLVAAVAWLWRMPGRPSFDLYNYADKPDLTSRQITEAIYGALGRRPPRLRMPLSLARALAVPFDWGISVTGRNIPISTARVEKLASAQTLFAADKIARTGFTRPVALQEGIRRTVEWFVTEGRLLSREWRTPPTEAGGDYSPFAFRTSAERSRN